MKVKIEEHYGLPFEKSVLAEKLNKLLADYHEKVDDHPLYKNLPVNKRIIGKNVQVILKDSINNPSYHIDLWAHETYVLNNRPNGFQNL